MDKRKFEALRGSIEQWMEKYAAIYAHVKENHDFQNPFRDLIAKTIPEQIVDCANLSYPYIVKGSYGKGLWTRTPWIAIFDQRITVSAQHGAYIVYLLNKDSKELFLTFELAATETVGESIDKNGKKQFIGIAARGGSYDTLKAKTELVREQLVDSYFSCDENINSGSAGYDTGAIYYKRYTLDSLPNGEALADDLQRMIALYEQYYKIKTDNNPWTPSHSDYTPGITKDRWLELLEDHSVIDRSWLEILAAFHASPDGVSCKAIGEQYGWDPSSVSGKCTQLAKRIWKETGCPLWKRDTGEDMYWPILFLGRDTEKGEVGGFVWKLRDELYEALTEFGIEQYLPKPGGDELQMTTREAVEYIRTYIASRGFSYEAGLIENFYLSLRSKPFVILAGTSGTGKTRLVKLFAEAVGATTDNGRYRMVPVRPDWSDSSDLFGHVDLNGCFVPGAVIDFIHDAEQDGRHPYFLCLDEMNLARVEYYLSDILSVIETRDLKNGQIVSDPLVPDTYYGSDGEARKKYGEVRFPENLYIIGTVNMDETTFPFSRKVLDRANTIEFSFVDLMPPTELPETPEIMPELPNSFLRSKYLLLSQCGDTDKVHSWCLTLQNLNEKLRTADAHVGYRVRDEIVFYMLNNAEAELLPEDDAMDNEIMQKILPRIQGSSASVRNMLCELFKFCAGDYDGYQTASDDISSKMMDVARKGKPRYRKSAEKIAYMVRRYEEDGFTSYWL